MTFAGDIRWGAELVAGAARKEALRAKRTHPAVLWFGPTYGVMEQVGSGWVMSGMTDPVPQASRDGLGWWFRVMARQRSTPEAAREEFWEASALLEVERPTELVVAGRRFRVVRADQFYRQGLNGPELPRPTDPDAEPERDPFNPTERFTKGLLSEAQVPGCAELLGERWEAVPEGTMVPREVTRDAKKALRTHPKIAVLPTRFAVTEEEDRYWPPMTGDISSPEGARLSLITYFEHIVPEMLQPSPEELAAYARAAARVRLERRNQISVNGRRFRIIRVETVIRVGPDGPEMPRPSDHDPDEPLTGETEELRTWGLADEDD